MATFLELKNQLANMLGAEAASELTTADQTRLGIYVNQAYRECYAPQNGVRPRWAVKKYTLEFAADDAFKEIVDAAASVIDVEKIPELVGEGPLSPFNSPTDEIRARASIAHDFLPPGGRSFGNFPTINTEDAEKGRPVFYYIDAADTGSDTTVKVRLYLYPVPDKAYDVSLTASVMPNELDDDPADQAPRLPGDVAWDILFPIACENLVLTDPRYNGDNKEAVSRQAERARIRLTSLAKHQKQRNIRLVKRRGW